MAITYGILSKMTDRAKYCQNFQNESTTMFVIDSVYMETMHYVVINKVDNQPYELHTKVVGMLGSTVCSIPVEEFVKQPIKLSYDEFLELAHKTHPGLEKSYEGINAGNWASYVDLYSKYIKNASKG